MSGFTEGQELAPQEYAVTRADLVRYAGASGDFNPIHWSDRVAREVGLPGVIAHGMYTMALAGRALDAWAGAPGHVRELGCKFTKPVVVPDDDAGVVVRVAGTVQSVEAAQLADAVPSADAARSAGHQLVRVRLEVTCAGEKVLGMPKALLWVPAPSAAAPEDDDG